VALVVPRPIGWISSIDGQGRVNLAPYSFYNLAGVSPNYVVFSSTGKTGAIKDSQRNIEDTGEFVVNLASWDLRHAMNQSSFEYAHGVDEMAQTGLKPAPSTLVKPPRVAQSPAALECLYHQTIALPSLEGAAHEAHLIIGKVIGVYINDNFIENGMVQTAKMRPMSRLGYMDFAVVDEVFQMPRPEAPQ
jgi:flavin reductase (DIM6/NTAB) family NADH-FMN oxidoreductase RutF